MEIVKITIMFKAWCPKTKELPLMSQLIVIYSIEILLSIEAFVKAAQMEYCVCMSFKAG